MIILKLTKNFSLEDIFLEKLQAPLVFLGLTLSSVRTDLYENAASSILIFSAKKRFFNVLKNVFVFEKICFKFKVLKTFKTFSECHVKKHRSLKRKAILKIRSTVFRGAYALSVSFEMKPLKKNVFLC